MVTRDSRLDILLSYDAILTSECSYMGGVCNTYGGTGAYVLLAGKPEGRGQLGRSRPRWEDKIKWILKNWNWEL
jgi:hypothetical protein